MKLLVPPDPDGDPIDDQTTPTSGVTMPGTPKPEVVPDDFRAAAEVPDEVYDLQESIFAVDDAYEGAFNIPVN